MRELFPVTKIQWVVCYSGKFSEHGRRADFNSRLRTVVVYLDYETKGNLHTLPVLANELINHHITSHWGHRWTGKFVIFGGRSVPSALDIVQKIIEEDREAVKAVQKLLEKAKEKDQFQY